MKMLRLAVVCAAALAVPGLANAAELARGPAVVEGRFIAEPLPTLQSLRALIAASKFDLPQDLPPMAAGLFGVFGYDMVRLLEPLGEPNPDPLDLPDAVLTRPSLVAIFDSVGQEIILVSAAYPDAGVAPREAFDAAVARLDAFETGLRDPLPVRAAPQPTPAPRRRPFRTHSTEARSKSKL